jgi:hypothetical protein
MLLFEIISKFKMAASSSEINQEDGRLENFMQEVGV